MPKRSLAQMSENCFIIERPAKRTRYYKKKDIKAHLLLHIPQMDPCNLIVAMVNSMVKGDQLQKVEQEALTCLKVQMQAPLVEIATLYGFKPFGSPFKWGNPKPSMPLGWTNSLHEFL